VHLVDSRLDRVGLVNGIAMLLALDPVRLRVRLDLPHVRAGGDIIDQGSVTRGDDDVRGPERPVGNAACREHGADRRLRARGLVLERPVDVPAASVLVIHRIGCAHVGLVLQVDDERSLFPGSSVLQDPGLDLHLVAAGRGPSVEHGERAD
jgi:hypothetical protein